MKKIRKKISLVNLLGTPGALLLGLGLYALFGAKGDPLFPILNNTTVVYLMVVVGVVIEIVQFVVLLPLFKKKALLSKSKSA